MENLKQFEQIIFLIKRHQASYLYDTPDHIICIISGS